MMGTCGNVFTLWMVVLRLLWCRKDRVDTVYEMKRSKCALASQSLDWLSAQYWQVCRSGSWLRTLAELFEKYICLAFFCIFFLLKAESKCSAARQAVDQTVWPEHTWVQVNGKLFLWFTTKSGGLNGAIYKLFTINIRSWKILLTGSQVSFILYISAPQTLYELAG